MLQKSQENGSGIAAGPGVDPRPRPLEVNAIVLKNGRIRTRKILTCLVFNHVQ